MPPEKPPETAETPGAGDDGPDPPLHLIDRARDLAVRAHASQRYGDEPYRVHLEEVVAVVRRYPHTPAMVAAAWLHDSVEDTELTLAEVAAAVGDDVAAIVAAVTDEPGATRAERKPPTLAKLRRATSAARGVKLADRIANLEAARRTGRLDLIAMYRAEHPEFHRHLFIPAEHDPQWSRLAELLGDTLPLQKPSNSS